MIEETYVAVMGKKMKECPDAQFYIVMRFLPAWVKENDRVIRCPLLSPSIPLLQGYQDGSVT